MWGPHLEGQYANSNPRVKGMEPISVLTLFLLPVAVGVHASTPRGFFFPYLLKFSPDNRARSCIFTKAEVWHHHLKQFRNRQLDFRIFLKTFHLSSERLLRFEVTAENPWYLSCQCMRRAEFVTGKQRRRPHPDTVAGCCFHLGQGLILEFPSSEFELKIPLGWSGETSSRNQVQFESPR